MKRRILTISTLFVIFLFVISGITTSLTVQGFDTLKLNENNLSSIEKEKVKTVDKIIADKHVTYTEHVVDDVYIKGDYILTHEDSNGKVTKYEKVWTEIDVDQFDFSDIGVDNTYWKKKVIFPKETDCENFYSFDKSKEYPLGCWEVRHEDGRTILYDTNGIEIGKGITAPSEKANSFLMTGPCYNEDEGEFRDEWCYLRENAKEWFEKWSVVKSIVYNPDPAEKISPQIKNSNFELFYEVAHGSYDWFSANTEKEYHQKDLKNDMQNRPPMKFAFIGSCGGMDETDDGSFSHAFRKGQMKDTVTVGYSGMAQCDGWKYAEYWQDEMFKNINEGFTIRYAFDLACQAYPSINESVVFCGDEKLTLVDKTGNNVPEAPDFTDIESGETSTEYSFDVVSSDEDKNPLYYKIDWDDDTIDLKGPYTSGEKITLSHKWKRRGTYTIKVESIDVYGKYAVSKSSIKISGTNQMSHTKTKLFLPNLFKNILKDFRGNSPNIKLINIISLCLHNCHQEYS